MLYVGRHRDARSLRGIARGIDAPLHERLRRAVLRLPAPCDDAAVQAPDHVPGDYKARAVGRIVVWGRDGSDAHAAALVPDALEAVEQLLAYRLHRIVHVVAYASNAEACAALDRAVVPTQLLAPLHTPELALIAMQIGEPPLRHVCHELAHVFTAERTGSVKRLGDHDIGMRLPRWLDDGFAVCVAAAVAGRPDTIEAALARSAAAEMSEEQLHAAFGDLASPDRSLAFAIATARVWQEVQAHGFPAVFAELAVRRSAGTIRPDQGARTP